MGSAARHERRRLVEYDSISRRLWILGQRCHHGATGTVVAGAAIAIARRYRRRSMVALLLTGGALMAHDWKDRSLWFQPGYGTQPYVDL
jgi:hypothetical protein